MSIKFKKLVWEPYHSNSWMVAKTPLFTIHVMEMDDNEFCFIVEVKHNITIYKDETFTTQAGAKQGAQDWIEQQLTQFIETSENPAQ